MKEYPIEHDEVDLRPLQTGRMNPAEYGFVHPRTCLPCHDAFIEYQGGILLVKRLNPPIIDALWPIGGLVMRGVPIEESMRAKVRAESGLELDDLTELGFGRTLFQTDPCGHGRGTDTINIAYFARGRGSLALDKLHAEPTIVTPDQYRSLRDDMHSYVRDFMDLAIPLL